MDIDIEVILKDILIKYQAAITNGDYRLSYSSLEEIFVIQKRVVLIHIEWHRIFDTPSLRIALDKYIELVDCQSC